jgi:[ribosomal protein S5]-alanine N-acetyltransferase
MKSGDNKKDSNREYIPVTNGYYLSEPEESAIGNLVKYLNDDFIYEQTLKIPKPYTYRDGEWYINFCWERKQKYGRTMEWSLFNENHELIGGIGLQGEFSDSPHRNVIGYWLGLPFRNQKIMSHVVLAFCDYAIKRDQLVRLEAHVFLNNPASCRILEKAGFVKEGLMKKFIFKDGAYKDCFLYALVK